MAEEHTSIDLKKLANSLEALHNEALTNVDVGEMNRDRIVKIYTIIRDLDDLQELIQGITNMDPVNPDFDARNLHDRIEMNIRNFKKFFENLKQVSIHTHHLKKAEKIIEKNDIEIKNLNIEINQLTNKVNSWELYNKYEKLHLSIKILINLIIPVVSTIYIVIADITTTMIKADKDMKESKIDSIKFHQQTDNETAIDSFRDTIKWNLNEAKDHYKKINDTSAFSQYRELSADIETLLASPDIPDEDEKFIKKLKEVIDTANDLHASLNPERNDSRFSP